jgi:hypothetical protein
MVQHHPAEDARIPAISMFAATAAPEWSSRPMGADPCERMNGPPAPRHAAMALLDDHEVVRRGTALHLSRDARFRIASHARSDELIDSLQQMRVDVAIIDLTLARDDRSVRADPLLREHFLASPCSLATTLDPHQPAHAMGVSGGQQGRTTADARGRDRAGIAGPSATATGPHAAGRLRRAQPQRARSTGAPAGGPDCFEIALRRHRSIKTVSTQKVAALRKLRLRNDAEIYAMRQQLESP